MRSVLTIAAICLTLAGVAAQAAEKRLDRTFTVVPGGQLTIEADGADIDVAGVDSNQVSVQILVTGSARAIEALTLSAEQDAGGVLVKAKREGSGWFNWSSGSRQSSIKVSVPKQYNARLKTSGGDISVSRLQGDLNGSTSGGNVRVVEVQGPVKMTTSGGNMDVARIAGKTDIRTSGGDIKVRDVRSDLRAETSGGNIQVEQVAGATFAHTSGGEVVVSNVRGNVDAESSGGGVKALQIDGGIRARSSGGDIGVELVGANRGIETSTSGGNIVIRMPRNTKGVIDASTSGGSVSTDLPVTTTEVRERRLAGTINGGGETIRARTTGGSIRMQASD